MLGPISTAELDHYSTMKEITITVVADFWRSIVTLKQFNIGTNLLICIEVSKSFRENLQGVQ